MKMKPDDALALREAQEPLTHRMILEEEDGDDEFAGIEIALTSISISARRIADALEKQNKLIDNLTRVQQVKR